MTDELVILRSFVIVFVIVLSLEFCVGIWMLKGFLCEWAEKKMNVKESKKDRSLKKRSKKQSSSLDCDSSASRKPDAKKRNKKKSSSSDSDSDN